MDLQVKVEVGLGVRVEELLLEAEVGVRVEEEEQQLVRIELSWPCKLDRIARHK